MFFFLNNVSKCVMKKKGNCSMSISKIMSNDLVINNTPSSSMQMKEAAPEATAAPVIVGKEAFDNPAEIAGRSQVNFRGGKFLSAKDLNKIATSNMLDKMSKSEISTAKKVILELMDKYKCSNLSDLSKNFQSEKIDAGDFACDIADAIAKQEPKADIDKVSSFILSVI